MNVSYNQLHHLEPNVSLIKNHANVKVSINVEVRKLWECDLQTIACSRV